ncbi:MAG: hypothetical protein AABY75_05435 [Bacteroidota bacterium]
MPTPWTPRAYERLSGGLNTQAGEIYLRDGEFAYLENAQVDNDGSLIARNGYADVAVAETTHLAGTGLFQRRPASGSNQLIKTCKNVGAWTQSALKIRSGATWSNVAPTAFTPSDHDFATFVQYKNNVYIFLWGGTTAVSKFDGTNWTLPAGTPAARIGVVFQERVFAAANPASPNTLYFTVTGDGDDYVGAGSGSIEIGSGDGDTIVGLAVLFNRIIVFKQNSVYVVDGNDYSSFTAQRVVADSGASSPRSILSIENQVYYLSDKGWYVTDGSTTRGVSELIRPTRLALNRAKDTMSFALHHRRRSQYLCTCSDTTSTTNNVALVYKYPSTVESSQVGGESSWSKFVAWPFHAGCVAKTSGGDEDLYFLHVSNGKLLIYERDEAGDTVDSDDSAAITFEARTRWMDHDAPQLSKFWRMLTITFQTDGTLASYITSLRLGIPGASQWIQIVLSQDNGGIQTQFFTEFNETTPVFEYLVLAPAGNSFTGVQKYIIEAQIVGNRGARAN